MAAPLFAPDQKDNVQFICQLSHKTMLFFILSENMLLQPTPPRQAVRLLDTSCLLLCRFVVRIICINECTLGMSDTKSPLPRLGIFGASFVIAAMFPLGTMCNTHSTLDNNIGTSTHKGTKSLLLLLRCTAMRDTCSTTLVIVGTFLKAALPHRCFICTMCDTYSSPLGMIVTSIMIASLYLGTMSNTPSSLYGLVITSIGIIASFLNCAVCDTHPTLHGSIGTTLDAAHFDLGSMCDTHSTLHDLVGTSPHKTATLGLGTMRGAYSSNSRFFDTSLEGASWFTTSANAWLDIRPRLPFDNRRLFLPAGGFLLLRLLYLLLLFTITSRNRGSRRDCNNDIVGHCSRVS